MDTGRNRHALTLMLRCPSCGWVCSADERGHPSEAKDCPHCHSPAQAETLCEESGCCDRVTHGTAGPSGFRMLCHKHWDMATP